MTTEPQPTTAHRSIELARTALGRYTATNSRGTTLAIGTGDDAEFTPVELILAAMGGCSMVDVDHIATRRAEPDTLTVTVAADKVADDQGHHLGPVTITFHAEFPDTPEGHAARDIVPTAARQSHQRLCTVSRTVMLPTPVTTRVDGAGEVASGA